MQIKSGDSEEEVGNTGVSGNGMEESRSASGSSSAKMKVKSTSQSLKSEDSVSRSPPEFKEEHTELIGGDITLKIEPGQPPKLARSSTQKVIARAPPMFDHMESKTEEATRGFLVIKECIYASKYLGSTEHAMECDCAEEWGKRSLTLERHIQGDHRIDTNFVPYR